MPLVLNNIGLEFLDEEGNENIFHAFMEHLITTGKMLPSYLGGGYLFCPIGTAEFWMRYKNIKDRSFGVDEIHSQCMSRSVWKVRCAGIRLDDRKEAMSEFECFNRYEDGGGILPIHVINPDIHPGYVKGDPLSMQVTAFPGEINYYLNEEEFLAAQPTNSEGSTLTLANGTLFPAGLLYNHAIYRPDEEKKYEFDDRVMFHATVKSLRHGIFNLECEDRSVFIRCVAETQFGELEFDHTIDQVPEEQQKNIMVGSIISGTCILSGDVAMWDYRNGIIRDHEHDLMALRYVFMRGNAERLYSILAEDAVYCTQTSGMEYKGADAIVKQLNYVHEHHLGKYIAQMAEITGFEADEELHYPAGTACVVLADNKQENLESIAFIKCREDGFIERIEISTDHRYRFKMREIYTAEEEFAG